MFKVPWVRSIIHGINLLQNPKYNKGLAFTAEERRVLMLEGLLPDIILTQDRQVQRVMSKLRQQSDPLQKYVYMLGLVNRNERLFYRCLVEHTSELLPIVYTPTVGLVCQTFGHIYRQPRGLYLSLGMRGRVEQVLNQWPSDHIKAIVFTDGERILGLGDLGTYGMGIPIGKLMLYTACGGVDPEGCLPVMIDTGTNNKTLLEDPMYTGLCQERDRSKAYDDLIEEFILAVQARWGEHTLLQFEDFANRNAFRLLRKFKDRCCTFNDDIQGTASVVLAGVYASLRCPGRKPKLSDNVFLFMGAGSAGIGIADLLAHAMCEDDSIPLEVARAQIWLVDSRGLIYKDRPAGCISDEKRRYAHAGLPEGVKDEQVHRLEDIVSVLKPSSLIGVCAQPGVFTEAVCRNMAKNEEHPLIFALSNPTSKAECTAKQAYYATDGKALYASGSPFDPVEYKGKLFVPGQGNNSFIFPGVGLAITATRAMRVTDQMFYLAAKTLAQHVRSQDLEVGLLYPPIDEIRNVSAAIAAAVSEEAYRAELATLQPKPGNLLEFMRGQMYDATYPSYLS